MEFLEARRLTGNNVIWDRPSAVVDVAFAIGEDRTALVDQWWIATEAMLAEVGWQGENTTCHHFIGGVSLALSAPIDSLYAAVELAEWAFQVASTDTPVATAVRENRDRIRTLIEEERSPRLLAIAAEARQRQIAFLWDDDDVSVGYGDGSQTWPADKLPQEINWLSKHDIPVALVTGTNGKTTTVRLATRILRATGHKVGLSSTDWVGFDDEVVDYGDYSGPGGARTALRQTAIDAAILETARGGLLRRGLGVERADVALITNVKEDHLGDFGSQNLDELLDLKWIVTSALDDKSVAILNADDQLLVSKSAALKSPICWFSLDPNNAVVLSHCEAGGQAVTVIDRKIMRIDGSNKVALCSIDDVPITLQGTARHNVSNALAAVGLTRAMGVADDAIVSGLASMMPNDNPGRCNLYTVDGTEVLLDFAHNPDAMEALFELATARPEKHRILCFGQAGDRTEEQIRELARGAWAIGLDHIIVSELADYYRGRTEGEVFAIIRDELLASGARENQISHNDIESDSLAEALERSGPGDLVIMLALADSSNLQAQLREMSG